MQDEGTIFKKYGIIIRGCRRLSEGSPRNSSDQNQGGQRRRREDDETRMKMLRARTGRLRTVRYLRSNA